MVYLLTQNSPKLYEFLKGIYILSRQAQNFSVNFTGYILYLVSKKQKHPPELITVLSDIEVGIIKFYHYYIPWFDQIDNFEPRKVNLRKLNKAFSYSRAVVLARKIYSETK